MKIKDLECAVELGREMEEVRGGTLRRRGRSALLDLDLDIIKVGNNDVYQTGSNQASLFFGGINAPTTVKAQGSVNGQFNGIGSVNTYSPSVSLNQGNTNSNSNWQTFSGFAINS